MYAIIKGNLHRVEGKELPLVFCPYAFPEQYTPYGTTRKPCGKWCALFQEVSIPSPSVILHCGQNVVYPLVQDIQPKLKEEGK